MSDLNPYEKYLDGRAPLKILNDTSFQIASALAVIGPERSALPTAPGKWSPAEIVCHLADCELVFAFRLRQTLAEDAPTIQPFDQEKWADYYPGIAASLALTAFTAMRSWNVLLITSALPAAANRTVTHPERGTMTFATIIETMAGHDLNHLAQLKKLAVVN